MSSSASHKTSEARASGFTLIELLVVLALIGLLAGLTLPLVRGSGPDLLDQSTRALGRLLEQRRLEAMRQGQAITIELEEVKEELGRGMVLEAPASDVTSLVFLPNGSSNGARWTLHRAGESRIIEVDWLTGKVRANGEN